jgi:hypothetical protein
MLGPHYSSGNKCKLPVFPNPHFSLYYQVPDNSAFEAEPTKVSGIKAYIHEVSEFLCVAWFNNYKDY